MGRLLLKIRTAFRLGLPNITRVALYKLGLKFGLNPVRRLAAARPIGPFLVCHHSLLMSGLWRVLAGISEVKRSGGP